MICRHLIKHIASDPCDIKITSTVVIMVIVIKPAANCFFCGE